MDKRTVNDIQKEFCQRLLSRMDNTSFKLDKKEWNIYNDEVVLPFYASTTRGPFFTIRPSFIVQIDALKTEISRIIGRKILSCGMFFLGPKLDKSLGVMNINEHVLNNRCKESLGYYWQIYDKSDVDWMVNWFVMYLDLGGWKFINIFKSHEAIYDLYKDIFINNLQDAPGLNILERSLGLGHEAHITMLYLGLKYNLEGIEELMELTLAHKKGTLYQEPALELKNYFASQQV